MNVIDCGNVRVVERREHFGFALKPAHTVMITREFFGKDLDRDVAFQPGVARAIDLPSPMAPLPSRAVISSDPSFVPIAMDIRRILLLLIPNG